jgi:lysozyme family protein
MAWTYASTQKGYANLWSQIKIKDKKSADRFARLITASEGRYRETERTTGVPWFFIGALHMRESSCNFSGVLHNGEHIIGTGRKTKLVPKGRGPFQTWQAAASDALKLKGLHKVTQWDVSRMAYEAERFNGLGYTTKGVNSPYLWAGSNLQQPGKYVADHVWDSKATDKQLGVMTVIKRLCELRPDIAKAVGGSYLPPPPDVEPAPKPKPETKPAIESKTIWAQIIAVITALGGALTDWKVATVIIIGAIAAFVIWERVARGDQSVIKGWFSK